MLTLAEYLEDYAPADTKKRGWEVIEKNLEDLENNVDPKNMNELRIRLLRVQSGERDLYF